MSITTAQVSVGTTPTQFKPDSRSMPPQASLLVYNRGTNPVYVGGPNVTPQNGFQVDPDQRMSFPVSSGGDRIFGVTSTGSSVCHVIQTDSYA